MVWGLAAVMGVSAIMSYTSNREAGRENRAGAELNARVARIQAKQVLELAEDDVTNLRRDEATMLAGQTAAFAGQGVDLGSDIVTQTTEQTQRVIDDEAAIIRNNARVKSWGLEVQAQQDITSGRVAQRRANDAAFASILGGATDIAMVRSQYNAGTIS